MMGKYGICPVPRSHCDVLFTNILLLFNEYVFSKAYLKDEQSYRPNSIETTETKEFLTYLLSKIPFNQSDFELGKLITSELYARREINAGRSSLSIVLVNSSKKVGSNYNTERLYARLKEMKEAATLAE